MKFFAHVLLQTVFLIQGLWDFIQALEVYLLVSDLGNYAVQYLANNFILLILRFGIWQSRYKRTDVLLIAMSVFWVILKIISGYMDIWIFRYLNIWIWGYMGIWISGYLEGWERIGIALGMDWERIR